MQLTCHGLHKQNVHIDLTHLNASKSNLEPSKQLDKRKYGMARIKSGTLKTP